MQGSHPVMRPTGVELQIDSGEGNLNIKAYIAAVVGPKRIAHGSKSTKRLLEANSTQLIVNNPASDQVAFVSVSLLALDGGTRVALFDRNQSVGNTAIPARLLNTTGSAAGISFEEVLLPGDELYARSVQGGGEFSVIVSVSWY